MNLRVAWRRPAVADEFRAQYPSVKNGNQFQSTPIMFNGVLYGSNGIGLVEAFDPATGKTIWVQELEDQGEEALIGQASRGVAYWGSGADGRILSVRGRYLLAVDPQTGKLIHSFGDGGKVDLSRYADTDKPFPGYRWRAAPLVVRDTVIVGSVVTRAGDVRGYDVRTGKMRWTFHVIPQPFSAREN